MTDEAEQSIPSRGSQPFAWAADIPGKFGAAPTVLFGYTEKLVKSIAAAGGDLVQPFPLYRQPALTDEERETVERAAKQMKYIRADNAAATLRKLLERTK
jgi:hypothetical protein